MAPSPADASPASHPFRLWPGVAAAIVLCIARYLVPALAPDLFLYGVIVGVVCVAAIAIWWLFLSRAPWLERLGAIAVMAIALAATSRLVDRSITGGMMGMMLPIYAIPVLAVALVAGFAIGSRSSTTARRLTMAAAIVVACLGLTTIRTDGIMGAGSQLTWRWTPTAEQRLLAQAPDEPIAPPPAAPAEAPKPSPVPAETSAAATPPPPIAPTPIEWPGFRGPARDGVIRATRISTDWSASPPAQLWHRAIGPGWSSFAVHGDLLYTQEQRGDEEIVACYKVSTGQPVWRHRDAARFWESNGGAGPRGTPTLSGDRVYAFGATGILNALDARTGAARWSRDVAADSGTKVPMWGFASSPLVIDDLVVIAAAGKLAAYDLATGQPRWFGPARGGSYSSPQLVTIDGVEQILQLSGAGATSVSPADGKVLWEHDWSGGSIVQPAQMPNGDILINAIASTGGIGIRRLAVVHDDNGWRAEERWTSIGLKPYFNDFVVHKGHAFGFDGNILSCIDLEDGKRVWKGGRYGGGQLVLLRDQDLLLVVSEEGELALVSATPDKFTEIARMPALDGKTWNHPVIVGGILLVRNGEEMAAFRLK